MTTNENLNNDSKKGLSQNAKRGALTLAGLGSGALLAWVIKKMMDDHTLSQTGVKNPELSGIPVIDAVAATETQTFDDAFNCAREEQGKGSFFEWGGKIHSTFYKEEWNKLNDEQKNGFIKQASTPVEHPVHVEDEHNSPIPEQPEQQKEVVQPQTPKGEQSKGNEQPQTSDYNDDNQTPHSELPHFDTVQEAEAYTPEYGQKVMLDKDDDGIIDVVAIDENNDGFVDMVAIDKDGDGDFDNYITNDTFYETTELTTQIVLDEDGHAVINPDYKGEAIPMKTFENTKNATPQMGEHGEEPLTLKPEDLVHHEPTPSDVPDPNDEEPTLSFGDLINEDPLGASDEPHSNDDDNHLPDLDADANVSDMHN